MPRPPNVKGGPVGGAGIWVATRMPGPPRFFLRWSGHPGRDPGNPRFQERGLGIRVWALALEVLGRRVGNSNAHKK